MIVLDQVTKYLIQTQLGYREIVPVLPSLNLTLSYNRGAAFSFLSEAGGWQQWFFVGLAIIVSAVILVWLYRLPSKDKWTACGLSLILGGALGNLWDRIMLGHVVDFIDFYVKTWHFATFNIADSAICVGASILILVSFQPKPKTVKQTY